MVQKAQVHAAAQPRPQAQGVQSLSPQDDILYQGGEPRWQERSGAARGVQEQAHSHGHLRPWRKNPFGRVKSNRCIASHGAGAGGDSGSGRATPTAERHREGKHGEALRSRGNREASSLCRAAARPPRRELAPTLTRIRLATVPPRRARAASRLPRARPVVEGAGSRGAGRGAPEAAPLEEGQSRMGPRRGGSGGQRPRRP